jgi:anti-sigma B factor antagonist
MNPELSTVGDVAILTPHGLLLGGNETEDLKQKVVELDGDGNSKLLIDLCKTDFMSSVGLTVIFLAYTKYAKRGARVKLCAVNRKIQQLFVLVRMTHVYGENLHATKEEALASFNSVTAP